MNITQRGVLPPVQFAELDATLQSSILPPAGSATVAGASIAKTTTMVTNSGGVTLTAAFTTVVDTASFNVATGDLIFVHYRLSGTKGATAGDIVIRLSQAGGTGTIEFPHTGGPNIDPVQGPASASLAWEYAGTFLMRCTIAGTATLRLEAASAGSDSDVGVNAGRLGRTHI